MRFVNKNNTLKLTLACLVACLVLILSNQFAPATARATTPIPPGCPGGPAGPKNPATVCPEPSEPEYVCPTTDEPEGFSCVDPAAQPQTSSASKPCHTKENNNKNYCDLVRKYVNPAIKLFSAIVGLVVVIGIIIGGIQFAASTGDPQKTAAARNRIRNCIIALIAYLFLAAFLQFIIPGGIR